MDVDKEQLGLALREQRVRHNRNSAASERFIRPTGSRSASYRKPRSFRVVQFGTVRGVRHIGNPFLPSGVVPRARSFACRVVVDVRARTTSWPCHDDVSSLPHCVTRHGATLFRSSTPDSSRSTRGAQFPSSELPNDITDGFRDAVPRPSSPTPRAARARGRRRPRASRGGPTCRHVHAMQCSAIQCDVM